MAIKTIEQLHAEHTGKVSDKWSIYLTEYGRIFQDYREKPIRLLEIGIQNGGSLEIWAQAFQNAQKLVGCDIDPKCAGLAFADPRIAVVVGDANTDPTQAAVLGHAPSFDLIIDDGSHRSSDIIKSFARYFPYLEDGGVYVAEDLHCSYWQRFEGGLYDPFSSIAFFKRLVDIINHEHWGIEKCRASFLDCFFKRYGINLDEDILRTIHSVEFINSLCVIRKAPPADNVLGARRIVGSADDVMPLPRQDPDFLLASTPSQTGNSRSSAYLLPEQELALRQKELANRNQRITWLMKDIADAKQIIGEREKWIAILQRELADREAQVGALMQTLEQNVAEHNETVAALNAAIAATRDEFTRSASWRLTKPIRFLGNLRNQLATHPPADLPPPSDNDDGLPVEPAPTAEASIAATETLPDVPAEETADEADMQPDASAVDGRNDYGEWVRRYDSLDEAAHSRILGRIQALPRRPMISVLMPVYDPPLEYLDAAILSVRQQLYPDWELCIADDASKNQAVRDLLKRHEEEDPRIRVSYRPENGHISHASNSALALATGEFVALFDHDDLLPEHALFCVAEAILAHPDAGLIYSDEDKIDPSGQRCEPYFKSDWNPDLFLSHNMVSHLGVYRTALVNKVGGFRAGFEGSQDYDLALRCIERLDFGQIVHIPRVLYHWRAHSASTAVSFEAKPYAVLAGERAITEHLARRGICAWIENLEFGMYRVHYTLPTTPPLVSLIIPTRNGLQLIRQCVGSILEKTQYPNYEILVIDNGSDDPETLEYFRAIAQEPKVRVIRDERPFNFSALNNAAVKLARGELVGLVNNDIEVISPEWLDEMASLALQPDIGAVGAKLLYPDNTLQHGGVLLGLAGVANHSHHRLPYGCHGYLARASLIQNFSAVTAACLVIRKSMYEQIGGLNESDLPVAFNDVDFCLRLREAGYRNVWTPYAELYHHESASRGREDTPEKQQRSSNENFYMETRWGAQLANDPAYNPNLTLDYMDFSLAWPPRVPRL